MQPTEGMSTPDQRIQHAGYLAESLNQRFMVSRSANTRACCKMTTFPCWLKADDTYFTLAESVQISRVPEVATNACQPNVSRSPSQIADPADRCDRALLARS